MSSNDLLQCIHAFLYNRNSVKYNHSTTHNDHSNSHVLGTTDLSISSSLPYCWARCFWRQDAIPTSWQSTEAKTCSMTSCCQRTHTHTRVRARTHARTHAHTRTHIHTDNRSTALFPGLPGWAGTRKVKPIWILLKQETVSGSGISWAMCKSAPRSRQITVPAPHCSVFYRRMPFLPPNHSVKALKPEGTKF